MQPGTLEGERRQQQVLGEGVRQTLFLMVERLMQEPHFQAMAPIEQKQYIENMWAQEISRSQGISKGELLGRFISERWGGERPLSPPRQ